MPTGTSNFQYLTEKDELVVSRIESWVKSDTSKAFVMDELEHHYIEMGSKVKERLKLMDVIGSRNLYFESDDENFIDEQLK